MTGSPDFGVDPVRLASLASTRQGRTSLKGFEYQTAYAVGRLAAMAAAREFPTGHAAAAFLRYDWAEDVDEVLQDGTVVFTQCKHGQSWGIPARLALVVLGFAPKLLWTPEDARSRLQFRLVTSDRRFSAGALGSRDREKLEQAVRPLALARLSTPPELRSDRQLWAADAAAFGHEELVDAIWQRLEVLYVPDGLIDDPQIGTLWGAENDALSLLLRAECLAPARQAEALGALRHLLSNNLAQHAVGSGAAPPRTLSCSDVQVALFSCRLPGGARRSFRVVDRSFLEGQAALPRRSFVARFPAWADVVHGSDPVVKFVERDQTNELVRELLDVQIPKAEGSDLTLPVTLVVGPPGCGKSTLVRRVAARLVTESDCVVADPGAYLSDLEPGRGDELERELNSLAALGRTIVLVLDDPVFRGSPWLALLSGLARAPRPDVVVLAATQRLPVAENRKDFARSLDISMFQMRESSAVERARMAQLHGRSPAQFSHRALTDFLALAMEAAADVPFERAIEGIWRTLNGGEPISEFARIRELNWRARAYLIVCFFHRFGVIPRIEHLRKMVAATGDDLPLAELEHQLSTLVVQDGWDLFTVQERSGDLFSWWSGPGLGASHESVARAAWAQRPCVSEDIGEVVASTFGGPGSGAAEIGAVAGQLLRHEPAEGKQFVAALEHAWQQRSEDGTADLRGLNMLVSAIVLNNPRGPRFRREFETAMKRCDGQSWLAALGIYVNTSLNPDKCVYPPNLVRLLTPIAEAADFSLAGVRATRFATSLQAHPPALAALITRIERELEQDAEDLHAALVEWYIREAPSERVVKRLARIARWSDARPHRTDLRSRVAQFAATAAVSHADKTRILSYAQRWALVSEKDRNRELWGAYGQLHDACVDPADQVAYAVIAEGFGVHGRSDQAWALWTRLGRLPAEPARRVVRWLIDQMEEGRANTAMREIVNAAFVAARTLPFRDDGPWEQDVQALDEASLRWASSTKFRLYPRWSETCLHLYSVHALPPYAVEPIFAHAGQLIDDHRGDESAAPLVRSAALALGVARRNPALSPSVKTLQRSIDLWDASTGWRADPRRAGVSQG